MRSLTTTTRKVTATALAATGLLAVLGGCSGGDGGRAAPSPLDSVIPAAQSDTPSFEIAADDVAPLDRAPLTPADTVRKYVSGEIDGVFERSYAVLSAASRQGVGSLEDWAEAAPLRPTIVGFEIDPPADPAAGAVSAVVTGEVTLVPRLDEVNGYVPEHATVEWRVVAEDGGWRLDPAGSSVRPVLPDEQLATAAARQWAQARQQCRVEGEYEGSLLGSPALGDGLCQLQGELVAGPPAPLDDALAPQVVAAFGPDALTWARTVAISGPSELSVVTAPFGDRWVVVGVTS